MNPPTIHKIYDERWEKDNYTDEKITRCMCLWSLGVQTKKRCLNRASKVFPARIPALRKHAATVSSPPISSWSQHRERHNLASDLQVLARDGMSARMGTRELRAARLNT